jgi:signal transduction histidine kinase
MIECYPGKLNQVFLNIMSNAIYAIQKKWVNEKGGKLIIETTDGDNNIIIKISDNGTGMDENTKKKIFDPFFTTKDVGEGTGLGMSIAYNTIKKHNGTIEVFSEQNQGASFIITLPFLQV